MDRLSPVAVAAALLLVVTTVPLFIVWALATDDGAGWLAVAAPIVAAVYGWRRVDDDRAPRRERARSALVWAWAAAAVASSAVLALA